jgi:hypothetical protein
MTVDRALTERTNIVLEVSDELLVGLDTQASALMAATRRHDNSLISRDRARQEVVLGALRSTEAIVRPKPTSVRYWQEWRDREEARDV